MRIIQNLVLLQAVVLLLVPFSDISHPPSWSNPHVTLPAATTLSTYLIESSSPTPPQSSLLLHPLPQPTLILQLLSRVEHGAETDSNVITPVPPTLRLPLPTCPRSRRDLQPTSPFWYHNHLESDDADADAPYLNVQLSPRSWTTRVRHWTAIFAFYFRFSLFSDYSFSYWPYSLVACLLMLLLFLSYTFSPLCRKQEFGHNTIAASPPHVTSPHPAIPRLRLCSKFPDREKLTTNLLRWYTQAYIFL